MSAKNYYTPKFTALDTFVLQEKFYKQMADLEYSLKFQRSTAREQIYCDPRKTKVAISMIGELCPGKNVVLRSLVKCLELEYGVKDIFGVKWGFRGFCEDYPKHWTKIDSASLEGIQHQGGAKLGTCRHVKFDSEKVADRLQDQGITQLYLIGGCHSTHNLNELHKVIRKRKLQIQIIGIPSSIDNDIPFVDRSFGFETAVAEAVPFITAANVEAEAAEYGVGIVRLMGRQTGILAVAASLASRDVNVCVVPEISF